MERVWLAAGVSNWLLKCANAGDIALAGAAAMAGTFGSAPPVGVADVAVLLLGGSGAGDDGTAMIDEKLSERHNN